MKMLKRIHEHEKGLTGEHTFNHLGQSVILIIFFIVWTLDSFFLKATTGFSRYFPIYFRIPLAIVFLNIAFLLLVSSEKILFRGDPKNKKVVRKGPFGLIRHPLYLGAILIYLGLSLLTLSVSSFFIFIIIFCFYNYMASYEEKLLIERFGEEYLKYMKEVPKWLPLAKK